MKEGRHIKGRKAYERGEDPHASQCAMMKTNQHSRNSRHDVAYLTEGKGRKGRGEGREGREAKEGKKERKRRKEGTEGKRLIKEGRKEKNHKVK